MDWSKGLHAATTSLIGLLLIYFTFSMYEVLNGTPEDLLGRAILWSAYIVAIVTYTILGPLSIAAKEDSATTVGSATVGWGIYTVGALIFLGTWGFINQLASTLMGSMGSYNQLIWLLVAVVYFSLLFVLPVMYTLYPAPFKRLVGWSR